jgi:anti-anti-sigma factor
VSPGNDRALRGTKSVETSARSAQLLIGPREHACLLYDTDEERLATLTVLAYEGRAEGERLLFLGEADDVLRRLDADGIDPDAFRALTIEEAYLAGGSFDPEATLALLHEEVRAARVAGYSGLRIVGEMSWVRSGLPGSDRVVEYERRVDGSQTILAATAVHPRVIQGANPRPKEPPRELRVEEVGSRLRLRGVVDISNVNQLARKIERAVDRGEDLEIDMSGLSFIDVTGLWVLYDAALRLRLQQKRVRLVSPPAPVEKVLEILGWDELDALEVARSRA